MSLRIPGVLAALGGFAWVLKTAMMWANGGTEGSSGVVGLLFEIGIVCIAMAGSVRVWFLVPSTKARWRILAVLVFLVGLVLMIDLPILIGWQVLGHVWIAEELGIILTALVALGAGVHWLFRGFGRTNAAPNAVR
ncbi:hypothetical protein GCM10027449_11510 [Sinomonas notoginsengisoli]|uniref:hypothetical protein n=1 Tax=Sinomonas notoginsengisoli TaxID=1457311 RepID=UPI001F1C1DB5|nr:hypothetical protein [Sinomonas notoginsengisoli]